MEAVNLTIRYIANIYTLPDWRGRGIATTLTRAILDAARATGLPRVWLRASALGRPVYERLGFVSNLAYMEFVF